MDPLGVKALSPTPRFSNWDISAEESPYHLAVKTSRDCIRKRQDAARDGGDSLEGPVHRLTHKPTYSKLKSKGSSLKSARDIQ